MTIPRLSVVIPAFNEEARLPRTLGCLREYLDACGSRYEIVVVDDGSSDATAVRAREAGGEVTTLLRNDTNRGKGCSVRRGMLAARGERRLMTDADLSTPIEELPRLTARMDQGFDVVIASRALPESRIEIRQGRFRENVGRVFNLLVRILALPDLMDTQCGFKLFTAETAAAAFSAASLDGFAFDVEVLAIARRRGYRIAELPVIWRNDAATRVGLSKGLLAFLDLVRIRARLWSGRYDVVPQ